VSKPLYSGRLHARELLVCFADPKIGRPGVEPEGHVLHVLPRTDGRYIVRDKRAAFGNQTVAVEASKAEAVETLHRLADAEGLDP